MNKFLCTNRRVNLLPYKEKTEIVNRIVFDEKSHEPENMCSGCRTCELTCAYIHENVGNPRRSRIKVVKIEPLIYQAVACKQCADPICAMVCPTSAFMKNHELGILTIDESVCIGCGNCVLACPFGALNIDPITKKAIKCDLCNGDPNCVKKCPTRVLKYVVDKDSSKLPQTLFAKGWKGKDVYNIAAQKKRADFIKLEKDLDKRFSCSLEGD